MITERELIARLARLGAETLHQWIEMGLVTPHRDAGGYVFDDLDEARVALVCDLHYGMGCEAESLPVILRLIDQLHQTRHSLRAISAAVAEQPDEIRVAITTRTRIVLGRTPDDRR